MTFSRLSLPVACGCVVLLSSGLAQAVPAYVRSDTSQPWGVNTNEQAMDLAFGVGAWDDLRFETVDPDDLFSGGYHFIYIDGSDGGADELQAFITTNGDTIETWVGGGGTLFLNAGPNEGGSQDWGFGGVALNYPDFAGSGTATDPLHPIWQGPFLPCAINFTGGSYAHASVSGDEITPVITNVDNPMGPPSVGEMHLGSGTVMFGGLTTSNFWEPQPDALNLRANILTYLATGAVQGPCHNGELDEGEECDDGNFLNNDDCVGACRFATCGDGYVQAGVEACDDGDDDNTDACLVGCIPASCGDGFTQVGVEGCDDGENGDDTDACTAGCVAAYCGDGHLWAGVETCEDGNGDDTDDCPGSCNPAVCGDGYVLAGVEPCDDGNDANDDDCLNGCIAPSCGDGFLQNGTEACDDANVDNTDACVGEVCQLASCGDGFVFEGFEECDDGNATPNDGCTACQLDGEEESSSDGGAEESSSDGGAESTSEGGGSSGAVDESGGAVDGSTSTPSDDSTGGPVTTAGADESTGGGDESESTGAAADGDDGGGCGCTTDGRDRGGLWLGGLLVVLGLRRRRAA